MKIEVEGKSKDEFRVTVIENDSRTEHTVTLDDEYYEKLTKGKMTKEELIEKSFEFLLKREPKESILSKFHLELINHYFPEFEGEMKGRVD